MLIQKDTITRDVPREVYERRFKKLGYYIVEGETKASMTREDAETNEREVLIAKLNERNIKFHYRAGIPKLKELLGE